MGNDRREMHAEQRKTFERGLKAVARGGRGARVVDEESMAAAD